MPRKKIVVKNIQEIRDGAQTNSKLNSFEMIVKERPRLFISIIIALAVTSALYILFNPESPEIITTHPNVSYNTDESSFSIFIRPSYFYSVGKVYVALNSPYAKCIAGFKEMMSLDKNSWVNVPLYSTPPSKKDYEKFADLGYINLNQVKIDFYKKDSIPPQELQLPCTPTTSKKDVLTSFNGDIVIKSVITPRDWVVLVIVFTSSLGATYGILNSILPKRYNR